MMCVLGDVVYVTWRTKFVNTTGHGDHVGGRSPSGGDGGPQLRLGANLKKKKKRKKRKLILLYQIDQLLAY